MIAESLRLYLFCQMIKWSHFPVAGGLYDQHPKLLEDWELIAGIEGRVRERETARQAAANSRGVKGRRR